MYHIFLKSSIRLLPRVTTPCISIVGHPGRKRRLYRCRSREEPTPSFLKVGGLHAALTRFNETQCSTIAIYLLKPTRTINKAKPFFFIFFLPTLSSRCLTSRKSDSFLKCLSLVNDDDGRPKGFLLSLLTLF